MTDHSDSLSKQGYHAIAVNGENRALESFSILNGRSGSGPIRNHNSLTVITRTALRLSPPTVPPFLEACEQDVSLRVQGQR